MRLRNIPAAEPAIEKSPYCIKDPNSLKGQWKMSISNNKPIYIEVGMGKGQFITTLAKQNPNIYYLGMEQYSSVLYRALQKMEEDPIENLSFLCYPAEELPEIFEPGEIDKIYLNFSDPWPKDRHAKRRLTSSRFLDRYAKIIKSEGYIEFKTDNIDLFKFSLEEIKAHSEFDLIEHTFDLHHNEKMNVGNVLTEYEEKFSAKGNPICKLIAKKN
ncbi:MAG: tRNA (guanosine(46)-N7)-methyltransferase TrmB [Lachnospiraceae bacterium]|nr:tRNA (guanosine(46)-N7)-methyltransferase TrmB [Lachnospiraceae bacterium]